MRFYLDTEFNGYAGDLISLALISEDNAYPSFYAVREMPVPLDPWVRKHVIPFLGESPIGEHPFKVAMRNYLLAMPSNALIIADWPEDIALLLKEMIDPGGIQVACFPTFCLIDSGPLSPSIPHNALSDASALREWHLKEITP